MNNFAENAADNAAAFAAGQGEVLKLIVTARGSIITILDAGEMDDAIDAAVNATETFYGGFSHSTTHVSHHPGRVLAYIDFGDYESHVEVFAGSRS